MPLTDTFLRNLKPSSSPKKYKDFDGLYLFCAPTGLKSWRHNYRFDGKQLTLTFGTYPLVSLREAREKLTEAKRALKAGINPALRKKCLQEAERAVALNSFEVVAREWFENKKTGLKDNYTSRILGRLEKDLFPYLAERPIAEITAPELLEVLRKMEARGAVDTAHRCLQYCGQIFRYAVAYGRAAQDISGNLSRLLKPAVHGHMASLTKEKEVAGLLSVIDTYPAGIVQSALKMAPYVFVRPGELRHAEWSEFDFNKALWHIPKEKMKMKVDHLVPLAR